jgi:hypothetical protein
MALQAPSETRSRPDAAYRRDPTHLPASGNGQTGLQADAVVARMLQVGENIEHLLAQLDQARLDLRRLSERIETLRHRPAAPGDATEAVRTAALQADQAAAAQLKLELTELSQRLASLEERLKAAMDTLQSLQSDALPTAQLQDTLQACERAETERQKVEAELEEQKQQLRQLGSLQQQDRDWDIKKTLRMHASSTALLSEFSSEQGQSANSDHATGSAGDAPPAGTQRRDLEGLVKDVGEIVRSAQGTAAKPNRATATPKALEQKVASVQGRWGTYFAKISNDASIDVNALIQWVMREAYMANGEDLKFYAHKVKFYTDMKKLLRQELQVARHFLSDNINRSDPTKLTRPLHKKRFSTVAQTAQDGTPTPKAPEDDGLAVDVKGLEDYIKELDNQLNTVGDDSQMAQLELQDMTQRQQKTLQTLSNLAKVFHETSMAIIRKIGN